MDGGDKLPEDMFQLLLDRCRGLEASHQKLKEQFDLVVQEKSYNVSTDEKEGTLDSNLWSAPEWGDIRGVFYTGSPYRNVLECLGHAIHVSRTGSWEIMYWNLAAEKLFGYKDYEVVGQRILHLLFDEEHFHSALAIMQSLNSGRGWSGQFRLRKRSGQNFMALVTMSPLYEDGELTGIVTVSSDAGVFNNTNTGYMRTNRDNAYEQSKSDKINFGKIQWRSQPQTAAVPQHASSVSNLASKVLFRKHGSVSGDTLRMREFEEVEVERHDVKADRPPKVPITRPAVSMSIGGSRTEALGLVKEDSVSELAQPLKTGVKFFQKLRTGVFSNLGKSVDENVSADSLVKNDAANVTYSPRVLMESTNDIYHIDGSKLVANVPNMKSVYLGDASPRQADSDKIPNSGECSGGALVSLLRKRLSDSHVFANSEIRWEDLQLREKIGHGSYGVVYRGLWNADVVAIKVFSQSEYPKETLLESKKEIDIMRRLRHPNVLLFMGAVISEERIAMVTEYMTRGSLFKTLHMSNQSLDIRRRLRMAIDVARGMNYLHSRNPAVVHRDLKSSNLLVDKNWNVKVGDFGLSKLKLATLSTAKSGIGTPAWMAPEELRNEPSTEKSDVFSFGVILWELMTESVPWSDFDSLEVVAIVGFDNGRLDLPDNIDPRVSSIISECWQSNPESRPSFEHIIHRMTHLVHEGVGTAP